jgi:short-subunit dehydrogenase
VTLPAPGDDRAAVVTGASSGTVGTRVHPLPTDLSERSRRATLPDRVAALGLVADILINNAGLSTLGRVAKSVPAQELNPIEVDVGAGVDLCSRFLPGMVDRHRGALLPLLSRNRPGMKRG